jgi:hypothetical protein
MQRAKKGEIPENENQDIIEELDEKDIIVNLSYVDRINDFMQRNDLLESGPVYYLYKFDNAQSGEGKSFLSKFTDTDPPDEDFIGKTFGSGRYMIVVAIPVCDKAPKGFMRAYRIKIHPYYDTLKKEIAAPPAAAPTFIQAPGASLTETIEVLKTLITAIAPLMAQKQESPDFSTMLFRNYEITSKVLEKNMLENVKNQSELQRKMLSMGNGEEMGNATQTDEEEPGLIEQLKPMIMEWLPTLIGNNTQAKAVQQMVKAAPQFKQIVTNKKDFKTLVAYLDQEKGKEITDKILFNLKLKRI